MNNESEQIKRLTAMLNVMKQQRDQLADSVVQLSAEVQMLNEKLVELGIPPSSTEG